MSGTYSKKLLVDIDLNGQEILNLKPQVYSELPATPATSDNGKIIAVDGVLYVAKAGAWVELAQGGDVSGIDSRVTALETTVADNKSAISTNASAIKTNADDIDALEKSVGSSSDTASATGSVYARIAQNTADIAIVKSTADAAATKTYVDEELAEKVDAVEGSTLLTSTQATKLANLADDANATYATKDEVSAIPKFDVEVVTELPTGANIDLATLYLVADADAAAGEYIEYIGIRGTVTNGVEDETGRTTEQIGTTAVDLSGYLKSADAATTYVAIVSGKGLSTNDYTTAEKTKLEGIAESAQVNVIESVKVDNAALTVTDKAVNIDLSGKQDSLTESQLAAVNSGITSTAVTQISTNTTNIDKKQDALSTDQLAAANSGITASKVATYDGYATTLAQKTEIYQTTITGNGTTTAFTIPLTSDTFTLSSVGSVIVYDSAGYEVIPAVQIGTSGVTIGFNTAPSADTTYTVRVIAIGTTTA